MNERQIIDAGAEKIISLPAETQFAPNGIVSRTLLRTANSRVVLFGFAAGQDLTEHTSTQSAVVQILSGECEFSLGGKPHGQDRRFDLPAAKPATRGQGHDGILDAFDIV